MAVYMNQNGYSKQKGAKNTYSGVWKSETTLKSAI